MKKVLTYTFFIGIMLYMAAFPQSAVYEAKKALVLCGEAVVPPLFVFSVCSQFLINTGFAKVIKKPFEKIMHPLFGINGAGAAAVVLGCISGYPIGAVCVCELYKNKELTKDEAQRLLGFCNNAGPLFIIGSVGTAMMGSKEAGYVLWAVHIVSSIICGMVLKMFSKSGGISRKSTGEYMSVNLAQAIGESVKSAIWTMLNICAYTVLFSVVISMLFSVIKPDKVGFLLGSALEITNAINKMCLAADEIFGGMDGVLPYAAFALGFGGVCVHMQVVGVVRKTNLGMGMYFLGKIMQAVISAAIIFALTKIIS